MKEANEEVKGLRKNVEDMVLRQTDIQGKSGLLEFMRGRIKEAARINPMVLRDFDGTPIDAMSGTFSKYELVLREGEFIEPLVKDKNFVIGVAM